MTAEAKAAAPAKESKAKAKADKTPKEPKVGVGTIAKDAIREGKSNEETLAIVKAKFPEAKTTIASVAWYRNNLRVNGEKIPTARELAKAKAEKDGTAKDAKGDKKGAKAAEKDPTA